MSKNPDQRIAEFMLRYGELTKELKVDFISYPVFHPSENNSWALTIQTQPVDTDKQPVKSPFNEPPKTS